ncbi:MAG: hypothetical protein EP329_19655, partial [Deltaproteobacteria bacterium]
MTRPTRSWATLLVLAALVGAPACSGEEAPRADASGPRTRDEPAAAARPEAAHAVERPESASDRAAEERARAAAQEAQERAFRFTASRFDADDLGVIGLELAPAARPAEVAEQLTPFAERLGVVAAAACRDGDRAGCVRLLALYATDVLAPKDLAAATALRDGLVTAWSTACRGGDDGACVSLLDLPAAIDVDDRVGVGRGVCARHRGVGCEVLAAATEAPPTRDTLRIQAAGLYVEACDDGDVRACERLAGMYRRDEVAHSKRPRARRTGLLEHARELWRARCDAGDA